jgi:beta-lactam-binding protein with PASTA domain
MASRAIRAAWFSWPANAMTGTVPASGAIVPQVSEAKFKSNLAGSLLIPGTRTTQAAGAVTVGNVVSSTPAAGTSQPAGTPVAYLVSV